MATINNRMDFEGWLRGHPRDVAVVLAARVGMRVFPLIGAWESRDRTDSNDKLFLAFYVLRAVAAPWAAAKYPAHGAVLSAARASASASASAASASIDYASVAAYVARAAASAASAASPSAYAYAALASAAAAAAASAAAYAPAVTYDARDSAASDIWKSIEADAELIEHGARPSTLAGIHLWDVNIWPALMPDGFVPLWARFRAELLAANQDWKVWTDWYDARLAGKPGGPRAIDIFRVTLSDEAANATAKESRAKDWKAILAPREADWEKDPAYVNALIKAKIAKKLAKRQQLPEPRAVEKLEDPIDTLPDTAAKDKDDLLASIVQLENNAIGARIVERGDHLAIDPSGDETDVTAAANPITCQLHAAVLRRAREFTPIALRLNNQHGWGGIRSVADRLLATIDCPTEQIPFRLGTAYDAVVEVATFLDQDNQLGQTNQSDIDRLDADARRQLSSLVVAAAPWIRRFPTAQHLDDEAGAFLTRPDLLAPASVIVDAASDSLTLLRKDIDALRSLIEASRRGELQGRKAAARSFFTIRNLISVVMGVTVTVSLGAVGSVVAEKSSLAKGTGQVILSAEGAIEEFVAGEPAHIRLAIREIIRRLKEEGTPPIDQPPAILPTSPRRHPRPREIDTRRGKVPDEASED